MAERISEMLSDKYRGSIVALCGGRQLGSHSDDSVDGSRCVSQKDVQDDFFFSTDFGMIGEGDWVMSQMEISKENRIRHI
jgi:hypothetical protein